MSNRENKIPDKAKVFLSYSRRDGSKLADELLIGLELAGFDAYMDKHDIAKGEDWEERLKALIVRADSVVYIISPASVRSDRCGWEVDRAVELGKRLIPVVYLDVPEAEVPVKLKRLNYIFFTEKQSFAQSLSELVTALRQDLNWIRMHTLLSEQAVRWKSRGGEDLLLRGAELGEALRWQENRKSDSPEIIELQSSFLKASVFAERARLRHSRRVAAVLVLLLAALTAGGLAWWQGQWLKERYFQLTHVRGQVLTTAQEKALTPQSPEFRECTFCPTMVVIPQGSFMMGAKEGMLDAGEMPIHPVSINGRLAVSKFEITFAEWSACARYGNCDDNISTSGWGGDRQPVINISWVDAKRYVDWLSRMTGKPYRLLSEAEWEYSARAGSQNLFSFGNDDETLLGQYAWYADNSDRKSHAVGKKKPNAFGLHDMHGNVKEWVEDCWKENYQGAPTDGSARTTGNCARRVVRGGSWLHRARALRSASRESLLADARRDDVGMRIARHW